MSGRPLSEIVSRTGGRLVGDGDRVITGVAPLGQAGPEHLTFLDPERPPQLLATARAGAVLVVQAHDGCPVTQLVVPNVRLALALALELFQEVPSWGDGVHPTAIVHPDATLGTGVVVGPLAVVGEGCQIGEHTRIDPGVVLYPGVRVGRSSHLQARCVLREGTVVGDRVILQPGVVLGADGFGYAQTEEHTHHKIPQLGSVVVEDDVEIGASSCIDRATMGVTRIRRGSKIDNLVQVGHNCDLGEHVILCGQSGIAGSCQAGHHVVLGGQAGVADHVTLGDGARIGAAAGVHHDVPAGAAVIGAPAIDAREFARVQAALRKLPAVLQRLRHLEQRLESGDTP
jgi:UDP-3-O-[3-hydroxymyristoyl] glucosamine N-acyltransferase